LLSGGARLDRRQPDGAFSIRVLALLTDEYTTAKWTFYAKPGVVPKKFS
jgi:hypothetical protein